MPSTSAKQHRFMEAIAHSPSFAKKVGVKQSVGKDFAAADKGKTFAKGGVTQQKINKQNTRHGMMDLPVANLNRFAGLKKGGIMKKRRFDEGGDVEDMGEEEYSAHQVDPNSRRAHGLYDEAPAKPTASPAAKPTAKTHRERFAKTAEASYKPKSSPTAAETPAPKKKSFSDFMEEGRSMRPLSRKFKQGGSVMKKPNSLFKGKETYGEELKEAKAIKSGKISPKQYAMGEKSEMKMKKGGIESRGKTKGTIIRMASGGSVSSASRRADGIAQRGKTRC